jgi:hypothetical protein
MAINLMAPKGSDDTAKMSAEIWKKLNEVKKSGKAKSEDRAESKAEAKK